MTAYGTIDSAVEAIRLGAFDYIQKPFSEQELLVKVRNALDRRRLASQVSFLATEFKDRYKFESIVGRSAPIREILGRIVRVAPTDAIVLITGESGTGKELVAKALHANSRRADRAFVTVNCAAITESLFESELFGHARGSFTGAVKARKGLFEEADGGTFFFDEIAETPLAFQAKLLRAIQENEIRRVGENKYPRRCSHHRGDQSGAVHRHRRKAVSSGPLLSTQRRAFSAAGATGAARRFARAHFVLPRQAQPQDGLPGAPRRQRSRGARALQLSRPHPGARAHDRASRRARA
jgi:hypothetical protein